MKKETPTTETWRASAPTPTPPLNAAQNAVTAVREERRNMKNLKGLPMAAMLVAVGVYLFGWWIVLGLALLALFPIGIIFANKAKNPELYSSRHWEEKYQAEGRYVTYWKVRRVVEESSDAGRAALFDIFWKGWGLGLFGLLFLILGLPILIEALKDNSPVAYGLWEALWRPLADLTAHLPIAIKWNEALRDFGHAQMIPFARHLVSVAYAAAVLGPCMCAYVACKYKAHAALGVFDILLFTPCTDNEKRYKSAHRWNKPCLTLIVIVLGMGYAQHFHGGSVNETDLRTMHASDVALEVFLSINWQSFAAFLSLFMVHNYYTCGRLWFPTMEKVALLKKNMENLRQNS